MFKTLRYGLFAALVPVAIGCGGESVQNFQGYGVGMPGSGLDQGGEVLVEKIFLSPIIATNGMDPTASPVQINQLYAFHYNGGFSGGLEVAGNPGCFVPTDIDSTFPVHDIPATANYVDWGDSITFRADGVSDLVVDKVTAGAEGLNDNRVNNGRFHKEGKFIYGGPTWQFGDFQGVSLTGGQEYEIDITEDGETRTLQAQMAREYDFPLDNKIGTEDVAIPLTPPTGGWEVTWEGLENPDTPHSRVHDFAFVAFAAFPGPEDRAATPVMLCNPDTVDGSVVITEDQLEGLPAAGIIQAGRLTHYMEEVDGQRFDMFAIWCAISAYQKVDL